MNKKFGPFIREIRIQKGLGQRELALKLVYQHLILMI